MKRMFFFHLSTSGFVSCLFGFVVGLFCCCFCLFVCLFVGFVCVTFLVFVVVVVVFAFDGGGGGRLFFLFFLQSRRLFYILLPCPLEETCIYVENSACMFPYLHPLHLKDRERGRNREEEEIDDQMVHIGKTCLTISKNKFDYNVCHFHANEPSVCR